MMVSETLAAAKILVDVQRRQKLRELESKDSFSRTPSCSPIAELLPATPLITRPVFGAHNLNLNLNVHRPLNLNDGLSRSSPSQSPIPCGPLLLLSEAQHMARNPTVTGERPGTSEVGIMKVGFSESTNNKDWSYSSITSKLYAARNKRINMSISYQHGHVGTTPDKENCPDQDRLYIRFMLAYGSDQHATRPVVRCPQHLEAGRVAGSPNEVMDLSPAARLISGTEEHVVKSHNVSAFHLKDMTSGRYSVVIPVSPSPVFKIFKTGSNEDQQSVEVDLSFGCLNTCLGAEYSMRNWNMIITLEKSDGTVLGRRVVPTKICASPKRERTVEEDNILNRKPKRSRNATPDEKEQRKNNSSDSPSTCFEPVSPPKSSKKVPSSILSVPVDSMEDYLILTQVKNELQSSPLLKTFFLTKIQSLSSMKATSISTSIK